MRRRVVITYIMLYGEKRNSARYMCMSLPTTRIVKRRSRLRPTDNTHSLCRRTLRHKHCVLQAWNAHMVFVDFILITIFIKLNFTIIQPLFLFILLHSHTHTIINNNHNYKRIIYNFIQDQHTQ